MTIQDVIDRLQSIMDEAVNEARNDEKALKTSTIIVYALAGAVEELKERDEDK